MGVEPLKSRSATGFLKILFSIEYYVTKNSSRDNFEAKEKQYENS